MVCKKCGYQNSSGAVFCSGCGTKLADMERKICKKCGTENEPNARFCSRCGANLKNNHHRIPVKVIVSAAIIALIVIIGVLVGVDQVKGKNTAVRIDFNTHYVEGQEMYATEYGQIDAYGAENNLLWSYTTESYECTQYNRIEELLKTDDRYYFSENGTVIALDCATGKVLWKNDEFGGVSTKCCMDEKGTLYLCAYTDPCFMAIDYDGKTVHRIERFDNDYTWAHKIELDGNYAVVTMELGPSAYRGAEGFVWRVNLKDGTYEMENPPSEEESISQFKNHMKETGSVIQTNDYGEAYCEDEFAFGTTIRRDQVKKIIFLDTLNSVPQTAYDISEGMDGSVMVWMGVKDDFSDREYLYIAADGPIIAPEDCSGLFANYTALEEIHFNDCFDTSEVTDMTGMFMGYGVKELDLSGFDTSKVRSMAWMFSHACLTKLDISSFDTGNVTNMQGMFSWFDCEEGLELRNFDTSNATDMSMMFAYCIELRVLDLSSFDTSGVTNMRNMFYRNLELEKLDISNFDTSSVTNMESMFYECGKVKQLDVSGFDTRRVIDMSDMFYCCSSLKSLDVSGFKTPAATDMSGMFYYLNVNYLDLRGFDFSNVMDASYMFFAAEELWNVDVNKINLPANANTEMMFEYCPAFQQTKETETAEHEPSGSWSEVRVSVGGTVSFPWIFDEPVKNCTGFTLHYQITDVEYGKINGTYVLYRKTLNNNWERVGKFDVNDQSEVIKTFTFDQPISFRELAVAAPSGRQFSFRSSMWFDNWVFQN